MFQFLESLYHKLFMQVYEASGNGNNSIKTYSIYYHIYNLLSGSQKHYEWDTQTHFIKMDQNVPVTNSIIT